MSLVICDDCSVLIDSDYDCECFDYATGAVKCEGCRDE